MAASGAAFISINPVPSCQAKCNISFIDILSQPRPGRKILEGIVNAMLVKEVHQMASLINVGDVISVWIPTALRCNFESNLKVVVVMGSIFFLSLRSYLTLRHAKSIDSLLMGHPISVV